MKDSLLILGAGLMQKPSIVSAKDLGFNVVVLDANPNAEEVPLADKFYRIDLKDRESIFECAEKLKKTENLKGIFTAGTDFSSSVSYAGEKLGFSCHSFESTLNATIKPRMRRCFEENNVPSPKFFSIKFDEIPDEFAKEKVFSAVKSLGFPCVVKPADNMGARGCRMIRSEEEAWNSVLAAAENSRSRTVILEEYMEGPEYSIDALVFNGTMTITGFADRHIFYKPYFIEMGHTMPSSVENSKKLELIAAFAKGVSALGLSCGAAKADIKYTKNGPQIGEIAARLSGGYMSGWTFPYSSGINLTEQAILIAAGKEPQKLLNGRIPLPVEDSPFALFDFPSKKVSAERAWISIPGTIDSIKLPENSEQSEVKNIFPRPVKQGDEIDFPRNNVQKCGNVITLSESKKNAVFYAKKTVSEIFIRLKPCNEKTEKFLFSESLPDEKGFPPPAFSAFNSIQELNLSGEIPENSSVLKDAENFPQLKKLLLSDEKDWSYQTILEVLRRFDSVCKKHPPLQRKKFWSALLKGSLQGAIYISDSCSNSEK